MSKNCSCGRPEVRDISVHADDCDYRADWEETKQTAVMLERRRAMCPLHGEPFREAWPKGFAIFMVKGFQLVTAVDGIWDEARRIHGLAPDALVEVKKLEEVLDAKPICCRLSRDQLLSLYLECGLGVTKRCKICGKKRPGAPYTATNIGRLSHLCFHCVAYDISANPYAD